MHSECTGGEIEKASGRVAFSGESPGEYFYDFLLTAAALSICVLIIEQDIVGNAWGSLSRYSVPLFWSFKPLFFIIKTRTGSLSGCYRFYAYLTFRNFFGVGREYWVHFLCSNIYIRI